MRRTKNISTRKKVLSYAQDMFLLAVCDSMLYQRPLFFW
jgi:hypothetical protein